MYLRALVQNKTELLLVDAITLMTGRNLRTVREIVGPLHVKNALEQAKKSERVP